MDLILNYAASTTYLIDCQETTLPRDFLKCC